MLEGRGRVGYELLTKWRTSRPRTASCTPQMGKGRWGVEAWGVKMWGRVDTGSGQTLERFGSEVTGEQT